MSSNTTVQTTNASGPPSRGPPIYLKVKTLDVETQDTRNHFIQFDENQSQYFNQPDRHHIIFRDQNHGSLRVWSGEPDNPDDPNTSLTNCRHHLLVPGGSKNVATFKGEKRLYRYELLYSLPPDTPVTIYDPSYADEIMEVSNSDGGTQYNPVLLPEFGKWRVFETGYRVDRLGSSSSCMVSPEGYADGTDSKFCKIFKIGTTVNSFTAEGKIVHLSMQPLEPFFKSCRPEEQTVSSAPQSLRLITGGRDFPVTSKGDTKVTYDNGEIISVQRIGDTKLCSVWQKHDADLLERGQKTLNRFWTIASDQEKTLEGQYFERYERKKWERRDKDKYIPPEGRSHTTIKIAQWPVLDQRMSKNP